MNFLQKLDYLMEQMHINKSILSQISGVPYTTIDGFYKKGYENAKMSTIKKIASALDVSLDYLIDDVGYGKDSYHSMGVGELIQVYRKEAGMTLDELAAASGVSKGALNKIISGETKSPTMDNMKGIAKALGKRLSDFDDGIIKKAPSWSEEARQMADTYMKLDGWGRRLLWSTAQHELERVQDEDRFLRETDPEEEPKVINLFLEPSAAGLALGETGQLCEPYELRETDPPNASYAIRIQGDSMEPDFPDGSIAFVCHDEMRDGDIGVFCVDGATVVKQWHFDRVLGVTHLFSLNRARADADLVITGGRSAVWQGKVITPKRYPLPGR